MAGMSDMGPAQGNEATTASSFGRGIDFNRFEPFTTGDTANQVFSSMFDGEVPLLTGGPQDRVVWFELQQAVQAEAIMWNAISNISKTRHETAMNSVRNIKS